MRRLNPSIIAVAIVLCFSSLCHAQQPTITFFDSDIRVRQDGSALVIETYEFSRVPARFDRNIPARVPGEIANKRFFIDAANVNDDAGNDLAYHVIGSSSHLTIRVPELAGRRLQIAYQVRNAVQFGVEDDEFVWSVNPPDMQVDAGGVTVTLPEAAAGQVHAQTFLRNRAGNSRAMLWSFNGQLPAIVEGAKVESGLPGTLAPGVAMVVHGSLPAGILTPPNALVRAGWFLRANPIVLFPFAVLAVMLVIWRVKPRDADPGRSVAPMYEPPEGLSPAEVGLLVDDRVDPRDISATLIDLAVRGYVRLERIRPEHDATGEREDYVVRLLKPREQWAGLAPHEVTMLFHTFYGGQWTQLSSLRLRFPDIVPSMRVSIVTSLKQKGMYRVDPDAAPIWRQGVMAAAYGVVYLVTSFPGALAYALAFLQLDSATLPSSWLLIALSMGSSALIVYLLGGKTTAKTFRGMRTLVEIRGFEEFIRTVEGDKLHRVEPGLFEKYLAYAMALGIEHKWTRAFEGIAIKQPEWTDWGVGDLFNSAEFGQVLDSAFKRVAPLSTPRGRGLVAVSSSLSSGAAIAKSAAR